MKPPFHSNYEPICLRPSLSSQHHLHNYMHIAGKESRYPGNCPEAFPLPHSHFEERMTTVHRLSGDRRSQVGTEDLKDSSSVSGKTATSNAPNLHPCIFFKHSILLDTHSSICILNIDSERRCSDFITVGNICSQQSTAGMPLINIHIRDKSIFMNNSSNKNLSHFGRILSIYSL